MTFNKIKTKEQAELKAKELWGDSAYVTTNGPRYIVGEINGIFRKEYGIGISWEDAFKRARLHIN